MTGFLVSSTEPAMLRAMGSSSTMPEQFGADVIWMSERHGIAGVQRKTIPDLVASVRSGLLGREITQMKEGLKFGCLVIEGQPKWTADGWLHDERLNWSQKQQAGVEWWVQGQGLWVTWTRDTAETVSRVEHLQQYLEKEKHGSLLHRPNPPRNEWGKLSNQSTAVYFLTGVPGIGPDIAARIFEKFGKVPLKWDVTIEELMEVEGVGKVRARQLWEVLGG